MPGRHGSAPAAGKGREQRAPGRQRQPAGGCCHAARHRGASRGVGSAPARTAATGPRHRQVPGRPGHPAPAATPARVGRATRVHWWIRDPAAASGARAAPAGHAAGSPPQIGTGSQRQRSAPGGRPHPQGRSADHRQATCLPPLRPAGHQPSAGWGAVAQRGRTRSCRSQSSTRAATARLMATSARLNTGNRIGTRARKSTT